MVSRALRIWAQHVIRTRDPFAEGDDPKIPGVYRIVRAHTAYEAPDGFKHNLAVGDVLALTALCENGWSDGFKMNDPTHTHRPDSAPRHGAHTNPRGDRG